MWIILTQDEQAVATKLSESKSMRENKEDLELVIFDAQSVVRRRVGRRSGTFVAGAVEHVTDTKTPHRCQILRVRLTADEYVRQKPRRLCDQAAARLAAQNRMHRFRVSRHVTAAAQACCCC